MLRRTGNRPARTAGGARDCGGAVVHRRCNRCQSSVANSARLPRCATRKVVAGRDRDRAQDRIESAACDQKIEEWTPPRTRSGLEGTWGVGQYQPGRTVQDRRPSRRSSIVPGEARTALRWQVNAGSRFSIARQKDVLQLLRGWLVV